MTTFNRLFFTTPQKAASPLASLLLTFLSTYLQKLYIFIRSFLLYYHSHFLFDLSIDLHVG